MEGHPVCLRSEPRLTAVNVGTVQEVEWRGQTVRTAIWKHSVPGPVTLRGVNLVGDDQADRSVHGGDDKAVYAYAMEDYEFWAAGSEKFEVCAGLFGENLTLRNLDLGGAVIGERWHVGSAILEVAQPRLPCFKLGIRVGDPDFPKRFQLALRPGAYLRVVEEGTVQAGDVVNVIFRPAHGVTVRLLAESVRDPAKVGNMAAVPGLPAFWRTRALSRSH